MPRETTLAGQDPPDGDGHDTLLSELDSHDLARALDTVAASDADVFDADEPLALQVASDEAFEKIAYDGVVDLENITDRRD